MLNNAISVDIAGTYNSSLSAQVGNNIESNIIQRILLAN